MARGGGGVGCPVGGGSFGLSTLPMLRRLRLSTLPLLSGDRTAHSKRDCSLLPSDLLRESCERRFTNQGGRIAKAIDGELIVKNLRL